MCRCNDIDLMKNNKIGFLPAIPTLLPAAKSLIPAASGLIGDITKNLTGDLLGNLFSKKSTNPAEGTFCQFSQKTDCFQDNGEWTNSTDGIDYRYLTGGGSYTSEKKDLWGATLLQVIRAYNTKLGYDTKIAKAIDDILNPTQNRWGKNYEILNEVGIRAKTKFRDLIKTTYQDRYNKLLQYFPDAETWGRNTATNANLLQNSDYNNIVNNSNMQGGQGSINKMLLYGGIGIVGLFIIYKLIKKK